MSINPRVRITKEDLMLDLKNKGFLDEGGVYHGVDFSKFETKNQNEKGIVIKDGFKYLINERSLRDGFKLSILNVSDQTEYFLYQIKDKLSKGGVYENVDFSKFKYEGSDKEYILIKDGYDYKLTGDIIKRGSELSILNVVDKDRYVLEKLNLTHKNKYTYPDFKYKGTNEKIKIYCKEENHGIFEQTHSGHSKGAGCPKCGLQYQPTTEEFLQKLEDLGFMKESGVYYGCSFENFIYVNNHTLGKVIDKFNFDHLLAAYSLIDGVKLDFNSVVDKTEFFKFKSKNIYGNLYDYSKVNYINSHTKVEIICKEHNSFFQSPNDHLSSRGCPHCSKTGYKPDKEGWFYIIDLENEITGLKGIGYGITNNFYNRFIQHKKTFKDNNIKYKIINVYKFENGEEAFNFEKLVKKHDGNIDYQISGFRSECLKYNFKDMLLEEISYTNGIPQIINIVYDSNEKLDFKNW
jgi:hypothetical protein